MSEERILEVSQAARARKVCPATIRRMCEAGMLPGAYDAGTRTRRHWRIPEAALKHVNPLPEDGYEEAIAAEERAEKAQRVGNAERLTSDPKAVKRA